MATALPRIEQATKPAGVSGRSRDDLDLYTGVGTELQFFDDGVGASTWLWQILDQPPGASASLTTPNASTTNLTNATVAGSYLVQLTVDGGTVPGTIYRIVAGIQINTPTWVIPPLNRPLRIPAKGETLEFNVESSPGTGVNTRGWAQEMDHWFRTISAYGFGTLLQAAGAPVGSEPFYTLNILGGSVVDAGGGVADVTVGGAGSANALIDTINSAGALAQGIPVAIDGAGNFVAADAEVGSPQDVEGLVSVAAGPGPVTIVTFGVASYVAGGLTPGQTYWLAVGGGISATPPSFAVAGRRITRIGTARTASTILVRIENVGQT